MPRRQVQFRKGELLSYPLTAIPDWGRQTRYAQGLITR